MTRVEKYLRRVLSRLVPLEILDLKKESWEAAAAKIPGAARFLREEGSRIAKAERAPTATEIHTLAEVLAALSFSPGGVEYLGLRFRSRYEAPTYYTAAAIPREVSFAKGSFGRLILEHGLQMQTVEIEANPLVGTDPWGGRSRHYLVQLVDRAGRQFQTPISMQVTGSPREIEMVLVAIASDAQMGEMFRGDVEAYASALGLDPAEPDAASGLDHLVDMSRRFREFLGEESYRHLVTSVTSGEEA